MATVGSLVVDLIARTTGFAQGMKNAEKNVVSLKSTVDGAKSTVASLGGVMASVGMGIGGLFAIKGAVHAFSEEQDAIAQLDASIRATGGAAGITTAEIQELASSLQKTTTYADDATIGAASLMATFSNIKGDVFKDAIAGVQDFAAKTGKDLPDAAMLLGKALNDPEKGLAKLEKAMGGLTAAEKSGIKSMIASGNQMGAQRLILDALSDRFGGSAAAAAGTFSGKIAQMQNAAGDLAEQLGGMLTPFIGAIADAIKWMVQSKYAFGVMVSGVGALVAAVTVWKGVAIATTIVNTLLQASMGPIGWAMMAAGAIAAGAAMAAYIYTLKQNGIEADGAATAETNRAKAIKAANDEALRSAEIAKIGKASQKVIGKAIGGMEKERDQRGMSDGEKKLDDFKRELADVWKSNKASLDKMTDAERMAFAKNQVAWLKKAEALQKDADNYSNHQKIQEKINELQKENAEFGKTEAEMKLDALKSMKGITDEELKFAKAQQESIDAKKAKKKLDEEAAKKHKEMQDKAADIIKANLTPLEKYNARLKELADLKGGGFFKGDKVGFDRARTDNFADMRKDQMSKYNPTAFLERGSQGLDSAINKSQQDPLYKLDATAQLQLAEAIKSATSLDEIAKSLAKGGGSVSIGS